MSVKFKACVPHFKTCALGLAAALALAACGSGGTSSSGTTTASGTGTGTGGGSGGGTTATPVIISNVSYGPHSRNVMDIYQPSGTCTANRPTVFFIHGGGFTVGDKAFTPAPDIAAEANAKGWNAVSMNYRLAGNNPVLSAAFQPIYNDSIAGLPGQPASIVNAAVAALEDATAALNFLAANQSAYCTDTTKLALWGSSAGSYTVLGAAYSLNHYGITRPDPDVVIDFWGDLVNDSHLEFMEAPFMILHGDADGTVAYQHALDLSAQGTAVGVPHSFYTVLGGGHANYNINTYMLNGKTIMDTTIDFIEAHIVGGAPVYETVSVP